LVQGFGRLEYIPSRFLLDSLQGALFDIYYFIRVNGARWFYEIEALGPLAAFYILYDLLP